MTLRDEIQTLIDDKRDDSAKRATSEGLHGVEYNLRVVDGWLKGIEDALGRLADEVENPRPGNVTQQ
jgi:hypothetical protein